MGDVLKPIKSLNSRSFRGFCPLGLHQGFALDPRLASERPPDPLPEIVLHPLTSNPGSAPIYTYSVEAECNRTDRTL
jgi:hypothetical protein